MDAQNESEREQPAGTGTQTVESAVERRPQRRWAWIIGLCALAVAVYFLLPVAMHGQAANQGRAAPGGGRGLRSGPPVIPVVAAVATRGDMPDYLNGLGSVTSLNTVTVRSRVDGQLMTVAFKEGQLVHKGELLAQIDPRPFEVQLTQAEGQLAKDEATLKNAQMDLQRYQVLFAQDAVPKQQLDTAAATVNQYEGVLKSDQGAIQNAKLNLTYSRVTAPITGRIGLRLVDPGNIVHASDPTGLVMITERQPIGVVFTIPEDSLPAVLRQMHSGRRLIVEAWDRDLKTRLATGTLLTVDNAIDPATGTVRLKAEFPNEDDTLFPNQFVNARLLVDTLRGTVVVPSAAIQRNQQSTFVFVVKPDNTVEIRNVDARLTEGNDTAVEGGLAPGETVVIEGVDKLQPGTKVIARNASANDRGPANRAGGHGPQGRNGAEAGSVNQGPPAEAGSPTQQPGSVPRQRGPNR